MSTLSNTILKWQKIAQQNTPVWIVGSLNFSKRKLIQFFNIINSRAVRATIAPFTFLSASVSSSHDFFQAFLMHDSLKEYGKTALDLFALGIWGNIWLSTYKNTQFVQFRFFQRRKRQKAIHYCETGQLEALQKLSFKDYNWSIFKSWAKSNPDVLPAQPMKVAIEHQQWDIVNYLIQKNTSFSYIDLNSMQVLIKAIITESQSKFSDEWYKDSHDLDKMIVQAPHDVFMRAFEKLKQQNNPNFEPYLLYSFYRRSLFTKDTQDSLVLFNKMRDYFQDDFVNRSFELISRKLEKHNSNSSSLFMLDKNILEINQGIKAILEKEKLQKIIKPSSKNASLNNRL